ncbi:MAG TPA: hypothetical protein VFN23_06780 [Ktedonobacteraceae bacterium]|nr:hypothetical protein [Ktedonobacteraceae bacterium]
MQQGQQQMQANYDLLAVFTEESKADAAESRLHKEGFGEDEVFRLATSLVRNGQFREHGPNRERSSVFLQTSRSGPNPLTVILFAIIFGLVLAGVMFAAHFAVSSLPELPSIIAGAVVGIIIGAVIGLLQRGRVRGAIGQNLNQPAVSEKKSGGGEDRKVVALRFPDPDNISRKSRARAILLNNGGKIDRSVGKRE